MTLAVRFLCIWLSATLAAYTPGAYTHLLVGLLESRGVPNAKNAPAANLRLRRRLTVEQVNSPTVNADSHSEMGGFVEQLRSAMQNVRTFLIGSSTLRIFNPLGVARPSVSARLLPLRC